MKNGKLVATLGAVALVAAVGLGSTLAYLTDKTDTVKNTFTFGNVSFEDNLGHGLTESKVERNADGVYEDVDNLPDGTEQWTVVKNDYTKLYPGENVVKDPTITLSAQSDDAWVFAKIEYDQDQYDIHLANGWKVYAVAIDKTYVLVRNENALKASEHSTIFTDVTVKDTVSATVKDENGVEKTAELKPIKVTAAAVQKVGFTTAADAQTVAADLLTPATAAPAED